MMGFGKSCRYELHPPMSLSDILAALLRGTPKRERTRATETQFGLPERPATRRNEPIWASLNSDEREDAAEVGVQVK
jgi:hypothetical protein